MPPRPVLKVRQSRPVSAVYIGKGVNFQEPAQSASYNSFLDGTPPGLPDLPEPPSPSSSIGSVKSGLPSPPATNSTGSGSTGDPSTIALRERPLSLHSNSSASTSSGSHYAAATPMKSSTNGKSSSRSSSRLGGTEMDGRVVDDDFDDDFDKDNDKDNADGDDTARLDRRLLSTTKPDNDHERGSSENMMALQRVKSLAQRNRMALDKLSRLGSPSPARGGTPNSRSPVPSNASAGSSRASRALRSLPQPPARSQDHGRSGSETERESTHPSQSNSAHSNSSHSSSSQSNASHPSIHRSVSHSSTAHRPTTPPPLPESHPSPNTSPYNRLRHTSAPASPQKARLIASSGSGSMSSGSNSSQSPSNRRRNRASMASMSHLQLADFEEEDGEEDTGLKTATGTARERTRDRTLNERDLITQSALAAVASSRQSPLGHRRRAALPKEFRSDLAEDNPSTSNGGGRGSVTGRHEPRRESPDNRRASWKAMIEPITPFRSTVDTDGYRRSSTVRERRISGDYYRSSSRASAVGRSPDALIRRERTQSLRTGSAESALGMRSPGGRTLLGEGLRAAGISRRSQDEPRGTLSGASGAGRSEDVFRERERRIEWSPQEIHDDGRRRVILERERDPGAPPRASTSMAHYQYLDRDELDAPGPGRSPALRGHRSTYSLVTREYSPPRRDRESGDRAASALDRYHNNGHPPPTPSSGPLLAVTHLQDRFSTASPFGSRRYTTPLPTQPVTPQSEHARLMLESLSMFETALSKIPRASPTAGAGTGSSQADLSSNAQGMVYAADRLYGLLKQGGARAMEAQVEAEVESASRDPHVKDIIDLWGNVAADYREGSRTADDLIRGITGLLLGMGRVVRELMADRGGSDFGSPSMHGRHVSLPDGDMRRASPDVGLHSGGGRAPQGDSSSGRQSAASRRSWEPSPREREREREDALRRLAGGSGAHLRPESVLARASPATFQKLRERESVQQLQTPPPPSHASNTRNQAGPSATGTGSTRRLFTPREQREQALDAKNAGTSGGRGNVVMPTLDSQETVQPSPTPASRQQRPSPNLDRSRTLLPLSIPKPLPVLPSESVRRHASLKVDPQGSLRDRERRRATLRGSERPTFPSLASPSMATTALTPHTVSNSRAFPTLRRSESDKSNPSQNVTFSRPMTVSVSMALSDLQKQHAEGERNRTTSTANEADRHAAQIAVKSPLSGSETGREVKKKTVGVKNSMVRMSLDSQRDDDRGSPANSRNLDVHAADRSAAQTILQQTGGAKRERRRTVTDIWPR